ncbi:MAG: hypothetical protein L6R41_006755 [Letrouitia leprolyta]|nr:MAG: hypothetical protein L6R41_006755 [Letrouitia leprolyta]
MPKYCPADISVEKLSSFPSLPPELRERVYHELLHDQPSSLFHLLTVNLRISSEVHPWIFKQPITFKGQQSLFKWLARVDAGFLSYVETVRFKLHDIDPSKIVGSLGERLRRQNILGRANGVGDPYKEACNLEIRQIAHILSMFKNLKTITLLEDTYSDPQPPGTMERDFVDYILKTLPLTELSISHKAFMHSQHHRESSTSVQRLRLTNYALFQSPILPIRTQSLPQLRNLTICSDLGRTYGKPRFYNQRFCGHEPPDQILRKLENFTICLHGCQAEEMPETLAYDALERFFVPLTNQATSLKTFRLWCPNWVGHTTSLMQSFTRLVSSSSLTHIDTRYWWSPLPSEYPPSIATIAVRFDKNHGMFPIWLQKLFDAIGSPRKHRKASFFTNHPNLKDILLYLPPQAQAELEHVETRRSAVTAICRDHGIRVRVVYEEFSCGRQD